MAYTLPQSVDPVVPSVVLIGVPNKKALEKVIAKLKLHRIDHSVFHESDDDLGLTAVATVPLNEDERAILQKYKLWNENDFSHAGSSVKERQPFRLEVGGLIPSPRTNARVA